MSDLRIAILIVGGICCLAFYVGSRVSGYRSRLARWSIYLLALLLIPVYFGFVWNRPIMASLLPNSGLIVLSNWLPLWASFFLGSYMTSPVICLSRRLILGSVTISLMAYSLAAPGLGSAPVCRQQPVEQELLYQTTPYTCSAACAASILRLHGIPATEGELADLCLTREGTHWMGLYRGLKLKTRLTPWTVEVEEFSQEALNSMTQPGVLALNVDVSRFEEDFDHGFSEHMGHTVVYLGRSPGDGTVVFDPSPDFGMEDWFAPTRDSVSDGVILRLVRREDAHQSAMGVYQKVNRMLKRRRLAAGLAQIP